MKTLIFLLYFFSANCLYGQLPTFYSNTTQKDSSISLVFKEYAKKYDFILGYSEDSYWFDGIKDYKIVGIKGDTCFLIEHTIKETKAELPSIKIKSIEKKSFLNLLSKLKQANFWTLEKDSLDQRCIDFTDSTKKCLDISDGVNYKFEAITSSVYRKIQSYMPDDYLKKFPTMTQRKLFIECRDLFEIFWKREE
jgi:hypothetical protein